MFGHMWSVGPEMGWWMVFTGLWQLVFWAAIIALVVWGVKRVAGHTMPGRLEPVDIARERLARGEITPQQYEEIRQILMAH